MLLTYFYSDLSVIEDLKYWFSLIVLSLLVSFFAWKLLVWKENTFNFRVTSISDSSFDKINYLFFLGDTVIYSAGMATIIIEANDDPNGIFSLEPLEKPVEEGKSNFFL